jgi:hypothetical protein
MDREEHYGVFVLIGKEWIQLPCRLVTKEEAADLLNIFPDPMLFVHWDHESQMHAAPKPLLEMLGLPEATW